MKRKSLIDSRGSIGIGSVLWGFFFLIFLMVPLYFFIFEQYVYHVTSNLCASKLDAALDQMELSLETPALSGAKREWVEGEAALKIKAAMNQIDDAKLTEMAVDTYYEDGMPIVSLILKMDYPAKTIAGRIFEADSRMTMIFYRTRELPYDK